LLQWGQMISCISVLPVLICCRSIELPINGFH